MRTSKLLLAAVTLAPLSAHAAYDYSWNFASTACVTNCNTITTTTGALNSTKTAYMTNTNGGLLDSGRTSGQDSRAVGSGNPDVNGKGNNQTFNISQQNNGATGSPTVNASGFSTNTTAGTAFDTATLALYTGGGLGVSSINDGNIGVDPHHAFDNLNGIDAGLFKFGQSVSLKSLTIGWPTTNATADISVLAYTGSTPFSGSIVGKTFDTLITSGWQFIGNYKFTTGTSPVSPVLNAANVSSSYWLVGAYSSSFGNANGGNKGSTNAGGTGVLDIANDYFKISGLAANKASTGSTPSATTPEPTSLFLLAIGVLGWNMTRKIKEQSIDSIMAIQA